MGRMAKLSFVYVKLEIFLNVLINGEAQITAGRMENFLKIMGIIPFYLIPKSSVPLGKSMIF